MRLVSPRTGLVVESTSPVQITQMIYGMGFHVLEDKQDTEPRATRTSKQSGTNSDSTDDSTSEDIPARSVS
jgi:hypothetical protein